MPPRTAALSTPLRAWKCPQCTTRNFSVSATTQAVGPEHPRYLPVPEPPQQSTPDRPFIKGRLPVPRDVFTGVQGADKSSDAWLAKATRVSGKPSTAEAGSRSEWKAKMSDMRRQNLKEGLKGLKARKTQFEARRNETSARRQAEREELVSRPEREDERLTTPSHGLDLDTLYGKPLSDPSREARLAFKKQNLEAHQAKERDERLSQLNTLYLRARSFIVTPEQLDKAVDEAFGTTNQPVTFGDGSGMYSKDKNSASVWAYGRPEKVQDMLNRANRTGGKGALSGAGGFSGINAERVRKIAEVLTEGKMAGSEDWK